MGSAVRNGGGAGKEGQGDRVMERPGEKQGRPGQSAVAAVCLWLRHLLC